MQRAERKEKNKKNIECNVYIAAIKYCALRA
jgi:hypothetical protein